MANQIYVPVYQKNNNILLNPNRSIPDNGIPISFPTNGFYAEPAYISVNGVQMNAVIKLKPSGLNQTIDSYYTTLTVTEINALANAAILYSGTFFDNTTQTNGGATVANQVLINSTQLANGFTLTNNRIDVTHTAVYFLDLSLQFTFTGGASNYNITVWYTINDEIAPNSAFTFTTTGAQNDQTLAVITDTIAINAGQYIKFYWWSQATGMKLLATAAGTNPTRPLSPSVNFSIFNVA